jgi:hypothetical protein
MNDKQFIKFIEEDGPESWMDKVNAIIEKYWKYFIGVAFGYFLAGIVRHLA